MLITCLCEVALSEEVVVEAASHVLVNMRACSKAISCVSWTLQGNNASATLETS
jgi:hypothetical protein